MLQTPTLYMSAANTRMYDWHDIFLISHKLVFDYKDILEVCQWAIRPANP